MCHIWMERYLSLFSEEIHLALIWNFWKKGGPKHWRVFRSKTTWDRCSLRSFCTSQAHDQAQALLSPWSSPTAVFSSLQRWFQPLYHLFAWFFSHLPITSPFLLPCKLPSLTYKPTAPYHLQPAPFHLQPAPFLPPHLPYMTSQQFSFPHALAWLHL